MQHILLVDNDSDMIAWGQKHLARDTVAVLSAETPEQAMQVIAEKKPDLILVEYNLKPLGTELLKQIRLRDPNALVIMLSNFPPTNAVIEAMKLGAFDFLKKQALPYELLAAVESALKSREEIRDPSAKPLKLDLGDQVMIGVSAPMQQVFKMIGRVSRGDAAVTITGESGCGKEVVARAVHKFSPRSAREFVAINCAAIPENLLESELFGHEKGAFTGASVQRIGRFEQCDGGTLFLDEIGDMPMQLQSKILRVLQEGEFSRVGGNQTLRTDVRVLAATNKNLEKEVEAGRFREDLFYRLNVVRIHLPPLRERPDDIRPLANFFLQRLVAKKKGNQRLRFAEATLDLLDSYNWPGNVRELENTILRAVALANTEVLMPKDLPLGSNFTEEPVPEAELGLELADVWKFALLHGGTHPLAWLQEKLTAYVLDSVGGDEALAAKILGSKILVSTTPRSRPTRGSGRGEG